MYGSDWVMIAMESGSDLYYRDFENVMQALEADYPGLTRQFFIENAAQYLGLGPDGATRKRMTDFLARKAIRPEWLEAPVLRR